MDERLGGTSDCCSKNALSLVIEVFGLGASCGGTLRAGDGPAAISGTRAAWCVGSGVAGLSKMARKEMMEDECRIWLDLRSREAGLGGIAGPRDGVEGRCCVTEGGVVLGGGVSRKALAGRTWLVEYSPILGESSIGPVMVVEGESFGRIESSVTLVSIKISLVVVSTTPGLAVSYLSCPWFLTSVGLMLALILVG